MSSAKILALPVMWARISPCSGRSDPRRRTAAPMPPAHPCRGAYQCGRRRGRCASPAPGRSWRRQRHEHPGAARRGQALVADHAAGPAGQDRRQDRPARPLDRFPDGRGHGAARAVPADPRGNRRAASITTASPMLSGAAGIRNAGRRQQENRAQISTGGAPFSAPTATTCRSDPPRASPRGRHRCICRRPADRLTARWTDRPSIRGMSVCILGLARGGIERRHPAL